MARPLCVLLVLTFVQTSVSQQGLEYDTDESIVAMGSAHCSGRVITDLCLPDNICIDTDTASLNATVTLTQFGPNVLNPPAAQLSGMCGLDCSLGALTESGEGSGVYGLTYAVRGTTRVLNFDAGSLGFYSGDYARNFTSQVPGEAGGETTTNLDVEMPFTVNTSGILVVELSAMTSQESNDDGFGIGNGSWAVKFAGGGTFLNDSYTVSGNNSEAWSGATEFAISAGDYEFEASYSHTAGGAAGGHMPTNVSVDYVFLDNFEVRLRWKPDCTGFIPCDSNCDGSIDSEDIDAFFLALSDPAAYANTYPNCNHECNNDINGDGSVDAEDIDAFFDCL